MKNSQIFQRGSRSMVIILLALVCAVVINVAMGMLPASVTKLDTTSMQMFDLSEQTLDMLSKLDADVTIYWLATTGAEDTYIQTLLERYTEKNGKLQIVKKDPNVDPTFTQQYYSSDFQDNSLVVQCGDRYQCVPYGDIFVMDQMAYLTSGEQSFTFEGESALTGALLYVTNEDVPKIYALTNHGEAELPEFALNGIKRQGMELVNLSLLTEATIPEDADGVLLYGPQRDISEEEKTLLSAYLKKGGSLLYLAGDPTVGKELPNLDSLLKACAGVTPVAGMVGEAETNHFYTGSPALLLPDLYSHAITNPLRNEKYQVIMPYSKSLDLDSERADTIKVTELLVTSKDAFAKQGTNQEAEKEEGDLEGPFAVATASEDQVSGARVVCIGSAAQYFLEESFNTMVSGGNQDFFLNALSWMCAYEDGISIHAKSLQYETLNMENTTASLWIAILLLIPVGYVIFGAVRFVQRKRR